MTNQSQDQGSTNGSTNGGATVKDAADRLQRALKSLENELGPMVKQLGKLQSSAQGDTAKNEDLAEQVQRAQLREQQYKEREREFSNLAQETTRELDTVISHVLGALGDD